MVIPRSVHKKIHPAWNEAWAEYFANFEKNNKRRPTKLELTQQVAKMNRQFKLEEHISGVVRYRSGKPSKGWVKID